MNAQRWTDLMRSFGWETNLETFAGLQAAYAENHRHYHNGEHVQACLEQLDRCVEQAEHPAEVELALWFHDAIYSPLSGANERKSADWAVSLMKLNRATAEAIACVERLIMATRHDAEPDTRDESLLVDIDLSILGADPGVYDAFEQAIRKEYAVVPGFVFRRKRAAVLAGFLKRPRIYANEPFHREREQQARVNLQAAIARLGGAA